MEYKLIHETRRIAYLEDQVNYYIKEGWKPYGDVIVYYSVPDQRMFCCQAMISETNEELENNPSQNN